jgi:hypothetical protein
MGTTGVPPERLVSVSAEAEEREVLDRGIFTAC